MRKQAIAAFVLAAFVTALTACSGQPIPSDGWQISPPGEGPAGEAGMTAPAYGYTATAGTAPEATTAGVSTTAASVSVTTRTVSRPRPTTPADDPQRPREEGKPSGPVVTLPKVTAAPTTRGTTSTTAAATTPPAATAATTAAVQATSTSASSASSAAPTTTATTAKPLMGTPPPVNPPLNGIDVSTFQKSIQWQQVKNAGVDFAMIRLGARGYGTAGTLFVDAYYKDNMEGAAAVGLDKGVYFFSQAVTVKEAREEAAYVLDKLKGYQITYPIAFDFENPPADDARTQVLNQSSMKSFNTDLVLAFCDTIRAAGYYPVVYTGLWWLNNRLDANRLKDRVDIWLAQYTSAAKPDYSPVTMWQYSSQGVVPGITGRVDMNRGYVDYAAFIRHDGWNHLS